MVGQIGQLGMLPYGLTTTKCFYNIAKDCKDYMDFLYEMQYMIGSFATPDGADWGEANIEEMNEVIAISNVTNCFNSLIWGFTSPIYPL